MMEIFIVTFVVFLLCCAALATGQLLGRKAINGSCRPNESGHCAHTENCSLRCIRHQHSELAPGVK